MCVKSKWVAILVSGSVCLFVFQNTMQGAAFNVANAIVNHRHQASEVALADEFGENRFNYSTYAFKTDQTFALATAPLDAASQATHMANLESLSSNNLLASATPIKSDRSLAFSNLPNHP